ncbi:MAG TPA: ABC transporter ATP-binding protein [Anaerolineae bacterium]|nr:ABC transporter ATP-binding protein [Anaerolineae bacterium]
MKFNPRRLGNDPASIALDWQIDNMSSPAPLLEVKNLSTHFLTDDGVMHAVEDVSFTLDRGQSLGLVGESGCGKTTTMLALMRLLPPNGRIVKGQVLLEGRDLLRLPDSEMQRVRWSKISLIFQGAMNALNPVRTVGDQIAESIRRHGLMGGRLDNHALDQRVRQLLDMVGIASSRQDQYPHQYSGGMRQRAMIAMALACTPDVVIADEPTTALDVMIQAQILDLLQKLQRELGLAVILITHDLAVVAEMCDRVLVMYGGKVAEYADVDAIYNEPLHPYTRLLLAAFPDLTQPEGKLVAIPGYPPRLNALPAGCRFEPRCPVRIGKCVTADPPLREVKPGHWVACHLVTEQLPIHPTTSLP